MRTSLNFYGQWSNDNRLPLNEYFNQKHFPPDYFSDGYATECKQDNFYPDQVSWEQRNVDEFDCMYDYSHSTMMEHSTLGELSLYERLLSDRRELIRLKLTNQLKQLQSIENERLFLKQMVCNQKQSSNFLRDKKRKTESTSIKQYIFCDSFRYMYDEEEKSSSKESFSHQSWSDKSKEQSSGSSEMTPEQ